MYESGCRSLGGVGCLVELGFVGLVGVIGVIDSYVRFATLSYLQRVILFFS